MSTVRRPRWYPPPPPTPKILNIPRRTRRKVIKPIIGKPVTENTTTTRRCYKGKLESLFDQERVFSRTVPIVLFNSGGGDCERRERVEEIDFRDRSRRRGDKEEEEEEEEEDVEKQKWRFQAEILRAECNFLRMERDIALKKLELNRVQTKRTLRSAVETLVSGKEKINEGRNASSVLEEEIGDLEDKLKELQRNSGVRDFEFRKCSNFDKEASLLQKRLEKLGEGLLSEEKCVKEIRQMAEASLTIKTYRKFDQSFSPDREIRFKDVEILRKKMEKLSKGMLEKMEEEYGSLLLSSASGSGNASATSSVSSSRRIEFPLLSTSAQTQSLLHHKENMFHEDKICSGRCKKIVRKIVEEVRAELDQWSQMQEMLERVRDEMQDMQNTRDFWQDRALNSDNQVQSLQSSVQEWKQKARYSQSKVTELEKHINELHLQLERLRDEPKMESTKVPQDTHKEKEKRVLICRLKENHQRDFNGNRKKETGHGMWRKEQVIGSGSVVPKRSPLRDMQNSPLPWDNTISVPFAMP
ncbi:hypothetical protein AQUCO_01400791v1 [Aquilegia coerulea]|uniref:Uncharacterized protein n=1 Tax=Aquilegia coerulea TaxID=218851 RepID=A0A2G5DY28_AQUCA|nr:hypothetical protein AQUCO_01400791v1 [Aquilegia coerulea]